MKYLLTLTLTGCMALASFSAIAADKDGRFAIKGVGVAKCSQFVEHVKQSKNLAEFGGWISGYLSAMNRMQDKTYDLAPWQDTQMLVLGIATFCQQNPDAQVHLAVATMAKSMEAERIKAHESLMALKQGDKVELIYRSVLKTVQTKLKAKGYKITTDGVYGTSTQEALKAFQRSKKLEATGLPDAITIQQLMY